MADERGKEVLRHATRAFSAKAQVDDLHQEIALNFFSARADFTDELVLGEEFANHQADSYPEMIRRDLGSAIGSMLRPSDRQWFKPFVDDEAVEADTAAQAWLDFSGKVLARILADPRAQFRRACSEADHDFAAFGQAAVMVNFNRARDGLVYRTIHLRDMAWCEGFEGSIDRVYRKTKGPVRHVAEQFGEKALPQQWRDMLEKQPEAPVTVYHCVMPSDAYEGERKIRAPWVSLYITETGDVLSEAGDGVNPYVIPRWQTISGKAYAVSPATIIALPQARLIQRMMVTLIEAAEKSVDPPLVATHEAIRSEVDLSAGGVTWVDIEYDEKMGAALRPLELGKNVNLGYDLINRQQEMLARIFYLDKLNLPQGQAKTAYETARLVEQYVRNALPLFEPMEDEYNARILDVTAQRAFQAGAFGPIETIPPALAGRDIQFRFANPLRESLEKAKLTAFQDTAGLLAQAMQVDQAAPQEIDLRTMLRDAVRATGAPAKWLRSDEDVAMLRQQAAEQQQAQAEMQGISQVADVVGKGAEAGGNVIDMLGRLNAA